ncbi:MAG TPA: hypothetical protein VFN76_09510 [Candidatus Limnocylindria bacterium]|nr:hypothetical protein [Candidatus Limnocylindria bacterium]
MRFLLALAAASALAALPVEQVAACSCAQTTVEEAAANAQAVFVGTVVDERPVGRDDGPVRAVAATAPMPGPTGQVIYTFKVEVVAKGDIGTQVELLGGGDGASCGMSFGIGERWLVFASWDGAVHTTNLCAGNRNLAPDEEPPLPMSAPGAEEAIPDAPIEIPWSALGVLGAIAIVLVASWFAFRTEPSRPIS